MQEITLNIFGMHCVSCALNVEAALKKTPGVKAGRVNFASGAALIEFDPQIVSVQDLLLRISEAGYKAEVQVEFSDSGSIQRDKETQSLKIKFIIAIILSGLLMFVAMPHCLPAVAGLALKICHFPIKQNAFIQFLFSSIVLACGYQFFTGGFRGLIKNRTANMDTLVALGVGSAYLYSLVVSIAIWYGNASLGADALYYEVSAFLISFILLGKYLGALTRRKTSLAIRRLLDLRPKIARVIREGQEEEVKAEDLKIGDVIIIRPGDRISVDGLVVEGASGVDESIVTGESMPVEKNIGDKVIAGSINKSGVFRFKAVKVGRETTLARIIKLVEDAQGSKAPVQELADKISAAFVPTVFFIAVAAFFIWFLAGKPFIFSLTVFISVLIIACPCTLGLAIPTAVMTGTGKAAENGIIIKNVVSLQRAGEVKTIIFDKTGTLTIGRPQLTDIVSFGGDNNVLRLAASLAKESGHPLAQAVANSAKSKNIDLLSVKDWMAFAGKGISGSVEGDMVVFGNRYLFKDRHIDISSAGKDLDRLESEGKTVILLAKNGRLNGLLAAKDTLKESAKSAVDRLKRMHKEVVMLTGDNRRTAGRIAQELGIDRVIAEVLPEDKVNEIKKMQARGAKTAFVGDGINDAPALTQADLGIAIGSGTDVAIESADIILIKDNLNDVVAALDLSCYTMRKIKQNLFFSFFYNVMGIPVAAGVLYPFTGFLLNPMVSGLAMSLSSVSVVLNSLSMLRYKKRV